MSNTPNWKWLLLLVLAVLALAAFSVYPPSKTLNLGLDLRGGTTFIYEVAVPDNADNKRLIEQTIEVLKDRVDPNGMMNLVWRRLAGNRFEVQMPAPSPNVKASRNDYLQRRKRLLAANISHAALDRALRRPPADRQAQLEQLTTDNPEVSGQIGALVEAYDEHASLQQAFDRAEQEHESLQRQFDASDGDKQAQDKLTTELGPKLDARIEMARTLLGASKRLTAARNFLLATNVDEPAIDLVLSQPVKPGPNNPRQAELDRLIQRYPARAEDIRELVNAYEAYEQLKGPLDDPADFIALMRGSGVLEFRIGATPQTLPNATEYRTSLKQKGPRGSSNDPYRWFAVDNNSAFADSQQEQQEMLTDPVTFFNGRGMIGDKFGDKLYLLLSQDLGSSMTQAQDWELASAFVTADERGFPAISFSLNTSGGQLMGKLTSASRGQPMAIVLDGRVMSAPNIRSTITSDGIITGGPTGFGQQELDYLIRTLNAGSLQARVSPEPIYVKSFDATFGRDNLDRGLRASYWALFVVAVFMAGYYFANGLIANFALFGNVLLILAVMASLRATFTLPGIAGIVLTIGMAVDANVLIFERIREELDSGAQVHVAVRAGYGKALATIIDANLTTLIICVVLGYTATAEVKGFAVTLGIGILATMFTALLGTRVLIEIYLMVTSAKTLNMMPIMVPRVGKMLHPNVDWVGLRSGFFTVSAALVVAGAMVVFARGEDMLDIEFRSGTAVAFSLSEGTQLDIADVKQRLSSSAQESGIIELEPSRAKVVITGDSEGTRGGSFSISTLANNQDNRVGKAIKAAFGDVLDVKRALTFVKSDVMEVGNAPVYAIRTAVLGVNINRPQVTESAAEYLGGVAIVLDGIDPPAPLDDLTERIDRLRLQPPHDGYGYRKYMLIGLDIAPASDDEQVTYRSAIVLARDDGTNYLEDPDMFTDTGGLAATEWNVVRDALTRESSLGSVTSFSPQVSRTMKINAIVAISLSLVAVVAYIWLRFGSLRYGLAAIVALVHDVTIAIGLVAAAGWIAHSGLGHLLLLSDFKVDLSIVAAVMTILGYSLNDTIVVFDRIRENRGRLAVVTPQIINDSINQTVSRTTITSATTILALVTLYLLGGDGVHGFAFMMLIGVVVGTYSSIAIAAPIVLMTTKPTSARS